jgi:hypothetical protein
MNNDRTVVLENKGKNPIGLKDTQGRIYNLNPEARMRISAASLQDILDYPGSKVLFEEDKAKVSNITRDELYRMGLTEEEINLFLLEEAKPVVVIKETLEVEEEEIIEIPVPEVKEEVKVEVKEEVKPVKKAAPKNNTTKKKSTVKKSK